MTKVTIIPNEGGYQKPLNGVVVNETKTKWIVDVDGKFGTWEFSKKDKLRLGVHKREFPRYEITFNKMNHKGVRHHFEGSGITSAKFKATKETLKRIVEVYVYNNDYLVGVEIWNNERTGEAHCLSWFEDYEFELVDDSASSEIFRG